MSELCPTCPIIECRERLKDKIDTPYVRLAQGWLNFLEISKSETVPVDKPGPERIEYEYSGQDGILGTLVELLCCSPGLVKVPDEIFETFGDSLVAGNEGLDEGGNTYEDANISIADGVVGHIILDK